MEISVVRHPDDVVNFKTTAVPSLRILSELITSTSYSLSTFLNGYRNKANFVATQAIGLDFDEGVTLQEAEEAFRNYRHIIAPTRSHRIEKNGKINDRFRVVLFLSQPIRDAETFEATWFTLAEKWPWLDKACKDASRFFYPSQFVHSTNETGQLIDPVAPKVKAKTILVDLGTLLPGDRGRLSRETRAFLTDGIRPEGLGRNHSTFKVAKDFQQNLYTYEETLSTIVTALETNGTIAPDFEENEVTSTVKSAFNSEPKHEPRVRQRAFKLSPIGELYKDQTEVEWVVQDLLMVGGLSIISADPKAGKSVIARQLTKDVLRGGEFFGRKCKQGSVYYFGMEEHSAVLKQSFQRLGINETDKLMVHVGDVTAESAFEDFRELLIETKPTLVVVDTLFDLVEVENENNYGEVKQKLRKLRQVARDSGTHILTVHHNSKSSGQYAARGNQRILGSQAISGAMDSIIVIGLEGKIRKISTSGREVRQWQERELVWDWNERTYSLGPEQTEDY
jgi:hypothetical protein